VIIKAEDHIEHYGTPRHSGRYPWGSGGAEATRNRSFLDMAEKMKKDGLSDTDIAKGMGMTTTQYRAQKTIALNQQKQEKIGMAQRLKDKGLSNVQIGKRMGINESSVRSLLAPGEKDKVDVLQSTANMLKKQVDSKNYIDIGAQVERDLPISGNAAAKVGISKDKFNTAVAMLQQQGYTVHYVKVQQLGTGNQTTIKVLAKPKTPYSEVYRDRDQIKQISDYSQDHGRSFLGVHDPISISSRRVEVKYAEDGGAAADGVIFVRPGKKDISIGNNHYAQVRIAVDGTHYLKGMAVYKDDLPDGVDLQFHTNKSKVEGKKGVMKPIKDDPDNPFGSTIRQIVEKGPDGKERVTSAMNIVGGKEGSGEEGGWSKWSKTLSSQILSKQNPKLIKQQLDVTYERKSDELNKIMALTNPAVRKKLLQAYSDSADSSAVHLKAAALPGSAHHVILPVSSMKPNEVYAPNYKNGQRVVLIRSPHAGTFEIPELTVNNRNREARALLGTKTEDAVGIHHTVAHKLSGADFDGDTVIVIPNDKGQITHSPSLDGLKDFDTIRAHPPYDGMKTIDGGTYSAKTRSVVYPPGGPRGSTKQDEMGKITNLIADMSIRGASNDEIARAVRHSMVVIDSEKHALDYKGSAKQNGIRDLKIKYQGEPTGSKRPSTAGASTLISRAGAEIRVPERKPRPASLGGPIDPVTGRKVFVPTNETFVNKQGKTVIKKQISKQLAETHDAHTLSSGTPIEGIYADYSNRVKGLANTARKEMVSTRPIPVSKSAKKVYSNEVSSLDSKLNIALKNAPRERQAQVIANATVSQKRQHNPNMGPEDVKKIKNQALAEARSRTGAGKHRIVITQPEWDAIQAGAISNHKLEQILNNADLDTVKKLATPKPELKMTSTKKARAQSMLESGYTQAEVAQALGVGLTTLKTSIGE
jgi:predicted transcriptional regulator